VNSNQQSLNNAVNIASVKNGFHSNVNAITLPNTLPLESHVWWLHCQIMFLSRASTVMKRTAAMNPGIRL